MSIFTIILVWLFWICYVMEILFIYWDLEILYVDVWWFYDMYTLVMYDLCPLRLFRIFIKTCCLIFVEDVASISWIFIRMFYRFNRNRALQKAFFELSCMIEEGTYALCSTLKLLYWKQRVMVPPHVLVSRIWRKKKYILHSCNDFINYVFHIISR